ncbi:hypothetical protein ACA910_016565 [Epithemia clementina (nom. ined.)]
MAEEIQVPPQDAQEGVDSSSPATTTTTTIALSTAADAATTSTTADDAVPESTNDMEPNNNKNDDEFDHSESNGAIFVIDGDDDDDDDDENVHESTTTLANKGEPERTSPSSPPQVGDDDDGAPTFLSSSSSSSSPQQEGGDDDDKGTLLPEEPPPQLDILSTNNDRGLPSESAPLEEEQPTTNPTTDPPEEEQEQGNSERSHHGQEGGGNSNHVPWTQESCQLLPAAEQADPVEGMTNDDDDDNDDDNNVANIADQTNNELIISPQSPLFQEEVPQLLAATTTTESASGNIVVVDPEPRGGMDNDSPEPRGGTDETSSTIPLTQESCQPLPAAEEAEPVEGTANDDEVNNNNNFDFANIADQTNNELIIPPQSSLFQEEVPQRLAATTTTESASGNIVVVDPEPRGGRHDDNIVNNDSVDQNLSPQSSSSPLNVNSAEEEEDKVATKESMAQSAAAPSSASMDDNDDDKAGKTQAVATVAAETEETAVTIVHADENDPVAMSEAEPTIGMNDGNDSVENENSKDDKPSLQSTSTFNDKNADDDDDDAVEKVKESMPESANATSIDDSKDKEDKLGSAAAASSTTITTTIPTSTAAGPVPEPATETTASILVNEDETDKPVLTTTTTAASSSSSSSSLENKEDQPLLQPPQASTNDGDDASLDPISNNDDGETTSSVQSPDRRPPDLDNDDDDDGDYDDGDYDGDDDGGRGNNDDDNDNLDDDNHDDDDNLDNAKDKHARASASLASPRTTVLTDSSANHDDGDNDGDDPNSENPAQSSSASVLQPSRNNQDDDNENANKKTTALAIQNHDAREESWQTPKEFVQKDDDNDNALLDNNNLHDDDNNNDDINDDNNNDKNDKEQGQVNISEASDSCNDPNQNIIREASTAVDHPSDYFTIMDESENDDNNNNQKPKIPTTTESHVEQPQSTSSILSPAMDVTQKEEAAAAAIASLEEQKLEDEATAISRIANQEIVPDDSTAIPSSSLDATPNNNGQEMEQEEPTFSSSSSSWFEQPFVSLDSSTATIHFEASSEHNKQQNLVHGQEDEDVDNKPQPTTEQTITTDSVNLEPLVVASEHPTAVDLAPPVANAVDQYYSIQSQNEQENEHNNEESTQVATIQSEIQPVVEQPQLQLLQTLETTSSHNNDDDDEVEIPTSMPGGTTLPSTDTSVVAAHDVLVIDDDDKLAKNAQAQPAEELPPVLVDDDDQQRRQQLTMIAPTMTLEPDDDDKNGENRNHDTRLDEPEQSLPQSSSPPQKQQEQEHGRVDGDVSLVLDLSPRTTAAGSSPKSSKNNDRGSENDALPRPQSSPPPHEGKGEDAGVVIASDDDPATTKMATTMISVSTDNYGSQDESQVEPASLPRPPQEEVADVSVDIDSATRTATDVVLESNNDVKNNIDDNAIPEKPEQTTQQLPLKEQQLQEPSASGVVSNDDPVATMATATISEFDDWGIDKYLSPDQPETLPISTPQQEELDASVSLNLPENSPPASAIALVSNPDPEDSLVPIIPQAEGPITDLNSAAPPVEPNLVLEPQPPTQQEPPGEDNVMVETTRTTTTTTGSTAPAALKDGVEENENDGRDFATASSPSQQQPERYDEPRSALEIDSTKTESQPLNPPTEQPLLQQLQPNTTIRKQDDVGSQEDNPPPANSTQTVCTTSAEPEPFETEQRRQEEPTLLGTVDNESSKGVLDAAQSSADKSQDESVSQLDASREQTAENPPLTTTGTEPCLYAGAKQLGSLPAEHPPSLKEQEQEQTAEVSSDKDRDTTQYIVNTEIPSPEESRSGQPLLEQRTTASEQEDDNGNCDTVEKEHDSTHSKLALEASEITPNQLLIPQQDVGKEQQQTTDTCVDDGENGNATSSEGAGPDPLTEHEPSLANEEESPEQNDNEVATKMIDIESHAGPEEPSLQKQTHQQMTDEALANNKEENVTNADSEAAPYSRQQQFNNNITEQTLSEREEPQQQPSNMLHESGNSPNDINENNATLQETGLAVVEDRPKPVGLENPSLSNLSNGCNDSNDNLHNKPLAAAADDKLSSQLQQNEHTRSRTDETNTTETSQKIDAEQKPELPVGTSDTKAELPADTPDVTDSTDELSQPQAQTVEQPASESKHSDVVQKSLDDCDSGQESVVEKREQNKEDLSSDQSKEQQHNFRSQLLPQPMATSDGDKLAEKVMESSSATERENLLQRTPAKSPKSSASSLTRSSPIPSSGVSFMRPPESQTPSQGRLMNNHNTPSASPKPSSQLQQPLRSSFRIPGASPQSSMGISPLPSFGNSPLPVLSTEADHTPKFHHRQRELEDDEAYEGYFQYLTERIMVASQPPVPPPVPPMPFQLPLVETKTPTTSNIQNKTGRIKQQGSIRFSPQPESETEDHGDEDEDDDEQEDEDYENDTDGSLSLGGSSSKNLASVIEEDNNQSSMNLLSLHNRSANVLNMHNSSPSAFTNSFLANLPATTPYWTRVSRFFEERQFLWLALDPFFEDNPGRNLIDDDDDDEDTEFDVPNTKRHSHLHPHSVQTIYAALHGQVVELPWDSAGGGGLVSTTPTLGTLLRICYTVHGWLERTNEKSVVVLACRNGQTKTALAAAACLRFLGTVPSTKDGFAQFVACTRQNSLHHEEQTVEDKVAPQALWKAMPPSIRNVLQHLDDVLERKRRCRDVFPQPLPLRLKAISLQGVPVEEKPCIELWDSSGELLFASHAHLYSDSNPDLPKTTSEWSDEEGLYLIKDRSSDDDITTSRRPRRMDDSYNSDDGNGNGENDVLLQGDFCLLGRFGGANHEYDVQDSSKWLFRYIQSTAFFKSNSGAIELNSDDVDLMPRYEPMFLERGDFGLTLIVEPYWKGANASPTTARSRATRHRRSTSPPCNPSALPPLYEGLDAMEEGWRSIAQYHICQPTNTDVEICRKKYSADLQQLQRPCPPHIVRLALQLAYGRHKPHEQQRDHLAQFLLTRGCLRNTWKPQKQYFKATTRRPSIINVARPLHQQPAWLWPSTPQTPDKPEDSSVPKEQQETYARHSASEKRLISFDGHDAAETNSELDNTAAMTPPKNNTKIIMASSQGAVAKAQGDQESKKEREDANDHQSVQSKATESETDRAGKRSGLDSDARPGGSADSEEVKESGGRAGLLAAIAAKASLIEDDNGTSGDGLAAVKSKDDIETLSGLMGGLSTNGTLTIRSDEVVDGTTDGGRAGLMAAIAAKGVISKADDGRGGLMAAIASKGSQVESRGDGDGARAGLMASIAAKGNAMKDTDKASDGGRAGLMAAIAKKSSAIDDTDNAAIGGRAGLMAAITKKGSTTNDTDGAADGGERAGLMAAIAKKGSTTKETDNAAIDGRAGLMAAVAKKGSVTNDTAGAADGGRAGLMAAIAKRGSTTNDTDGAADGGRAGLMAAIAKRNSTTNDTDGAADGGGRAGLMAAIAKKGIAAKDTDGAAEGGRAGLMTAIAKKGSVTNDTDGGAEGGGRAGLMAAIAKKASAVESKDGRGSDGRSGLMSAIAAKGSEGKATDTADAGKTGSNNNTQAAQKLPESNDKVGGQAGSIEGSELLAQLHKLGITVEDLARLDQVAELIKQKAGSIPETPNNLKADDKDVAMKNDSRFGKYWKMKNVGIPEGAIRNALKKDGWDETIWDNLDWDKNYEQQQTSEACSSKEEKKEESNDKPDKPSMKEDSRFAKYHKMKHVGLPEGAIRNAMTKDGVDPSILDLDWDKNYEEQTATSKSSAGSESSGPSMKEDERFAKYHKMKAVGLPDGAIANAMTRDGVDPSILDLDWDKNYEAQTQSVTAMESAPSGPSMKDDERFAKYWKMKSVGLPDGAIMNAMTRDGVDPKALDLDWDKNYEAQTQPAGTANASGPSGPPMKDDERFAKYWKMKSVGLPDGAIANAMTRDGVDPKALDLDWDKNYETQTQPAAASAAAPAPSGPPMKEDERFAKYWKMKSVGLPDGAIMNAMSRDGVDPKAIDLDWDKNYESQTQPAGASAEADTGPPLKDDPEYEKYFKMLAVGLPPPAVQNAMSRDGKDPKILDLDPNKSVASQLKAPASKKAPAKKLKKVRRKKIYWTPIDPGQIKEDSLWSIVKGKLSMNTLDYDVKEFEDLFTESADPADKKQKKEKKAGGEKKEKKSVQVIDGKRSMNGGIILLRLRMAYNTIASMVDKMEMGSFDSTQLRALKEHLPTPDERKGLELYMSQAGDNEEKRQFFYADLSDCEKYMYTIMNVAQADKKFDCMIFRSQFQSRYDEVLESIKLIEKACDEVRTSDKLRQIMGMILVLVNEINTGGEGKGAAEGFSLEALLKLNEAKAFDKKTSVLQYMVKLVMRNDEELLQFPKDLAHGKKADNVILDNLVTDMKNLGQDLEAVIGIAKEDAERAEQAGERTFSLEDLKGQKTSIHVSTSGVPSFNQINHHTGRTPMERFTLKAAASIKAAIELADNVQQKFIDLLRYFGEDEKMASDDFFRTMNQFVVEFEKAKAEVDKAEKARIKAEKKEAEKKKKEEKAKAKAAKAKAKADAAGGKNGQEDAKTGSERGEVSNTSTLEGVTSTPAEESSDRDAGRANLMSAISTANKDRGSAGLPAGLGSPKSPTQEDGSSNNRGGRAGLLAAIASKGEASRSNDSGVGKTGLMAAITSKGKSGDTGDGSGRAGLMAAIASKTKSSAEKAVGVGRAGLLAAIALKGKPSEEKAGDGRSGLMAAIASKGKPSGEKGKSSEERAGDGRSGLMAAIASKGKSSEEKAGDGRSGLMAAIASKGKSTDDESGDGRSGVMAAIASKGKSSEEKAGDGRSGLMAAIASKGKSSEEKAGNGRSGLMAAIASKGKSSEEKAGDGRSGLMAAIASKGKSTDDESGDGRSGLMAAIASKGKSSEENAGESRAGLMAVIASNGKSSKEKAGEGRSGLMAAIASKGKSSEEKAGDGRSGLMAAIASKGKSSEEKAGDGRSGVMAAIASKGKSSEENAGDSRSGLMAAIASKGKSLDEKAGDDRSGLLVAMASKGKSTDDDPGDGRSGLMAAIASKGKSSDDEPGDGRADLMAAIASKGKSSDDKTGDGRAGLMAAIASKSKSSDDRTGDGRAGLMAAIASKGKSNDDEVGDGLMANIASKRMSSDNKAGDGRAGMMAAIASQGKSSDDKAGDGRAGLMAVIASEVKSSDDKASDGRAGLMAAIASKGKSSEEKAGDGRAGLMAAIASKDKSSEKEAGDSISGLMAAISSKGKSSEKKAGEGRSDLMAAIASKGKSTDDGSGDGRSGLMAAIAAGGKSTDDEPGDGRAGLMAAIALKGKSNDDTTGDGLMAAIPSKRTLSDNDAGDGRAVLMAAIALKGKSRDEKAGDDRAGLMASIAPEVKSSDDKTGDGRAGLMATIASKGKSSDDKSGDGRAGLMAAIASEGKSSDDKAGDGRAGLMAAIVSKGKLSKEKAGDGRAGVMAAIASEGKLSEDESGDGRVGLMAAIASKGKSGDDESGDGRAGLMAAIASKGKSGDGESGEGRAGLMAAIASKGKSSDDNSVDGRAGPMSAIECSEEKSGDGRAGQTAPILLKGKSNHESGDGRAGPMAASASKGKPNDDESGDGRAGLMAAIAWKGKSSEETSGLIAAIASKGKSIEEMAGNARSGLMAAIASKGKSSEETSDVRSGLMAPIGSKGQSNEDESGAGRAGLMAAIASKGKSIEKMAGNAKAGLMAAIGSTGKPNEETSGNVSGLMAAISSKREPSEENGGHDRAGFMAALEAPTREGLLPANDVVAEGNDDNHEHNIVRRADGSIWKRTEGGRLERVVEVSNAIATRSSSDTTTMNQNTSSGDSGEDGRMGLLDAIKTSQGSER